MSTTKELAKAASTPAATSNGKTETPQAPLIEPAAQQTPSTTAESIESRLEKFYQLERLKERRDQVEDALKDLTGFHLAPTGGASVKLTDGRGTTFAISHPLVIGDMVGSAKNKLAAELAAIDAQFLV